jgi:hypothetical protein
MHCLEICVENSKVNISIALCCLIQHSLTTDCFCIFNVVVATGHCDVEACLASVCDEYDEAIWIVRISAISAILVHCISLSVPARELENAPLY